MIQEMSEMQCDFVASSLRMQVNRLQNILSVIERDTVDRGYTFDSLKEIEACLRQIRKVCGNN